MEKNDRNLLITVLVAGAATAAAWLLRSYLEHENWNGGRCRTCGTLLAVHRRKGRTVEYVCTSCDEIVCTEER